MAGPKGYSTYRGRTSPGKIILILLLVAVIIGAVGFLLLQDQLVFDSSGPHFEMLQPKSPANADASAEVTLEIEEPPSVPVDEPASQPQPPAPVKRVELHGVQLSQTPLTDWSGTAQRLPEGTDAVAVTVKDGLGYVYSPTDVQTAVTIGAVKASEKTAVALEDLTQSDTYAIARLSLLHDSVYSMANMADAGLCQPSGYVWYDNHNLHWLDPNKVMARQYLCQLVRSCAEQGFDEILLTDFTYPTLGKLHKIDYRGADKPAALHALLSDLKATLSEYDITLSVELPAESLLGSVNENSGLDLTDVVPRVDRVYAVTVEADVPALTEAVTALSETTNFVPELTAAPEAGSYLLLS